MANNCMKMEQFQGKSCLNFIFQYVSQEMLISSGNVEPRNKTIVLYVQKYLMCQLTSHVLLNGTALKTVSKVLIHFARNVIDI